MKTKKLALFTFAIGLVIPLSSCFLDKYNPFKKDEPNTDQKSQHTHNFEEKHDETNHWLECECGEIKDKVSHSLEVSGTTQANCEHGLVHTYTCSCGYSYTEDDDNKVHNFECHHDETSHWCVCKDCGISTEHVNHTLEFVSAVPATCNTGEQSIYKCSDCEYQVELETSAAKGHHIVSKITKVATCQEDGTKVYSCTDCDYYYEESYSDKDAHSFDHGVTNDNVTTYSCVNHGCTHSYDVVSFKEETSATIDSSVLSNVGAVELKEATIKFDEQSLSTFSEDITISAEKVTESVVEEVASEETKNLLKDAPIYQFSLTDGGKDVHVFSGEVEVSLPYTLGENEDPDSISILYIDEEGETQNILAHYANGLVSFKTIHFSIYAVVKMSKEEMCKKFGHNYYCYKETESTCVNHGHKVEICTRCGQFHTEEKELLEHKYEFFEVVPSTNTEHGHTTYKCSECGKEYKCELPLIQEKELSDYVSIIKSIADSNLKLSIEEKYENKQANTLEEYICVNIDKPFDLQIKNKTDLILSDETGSYGYTNYNVYHFEDDIVSTLKVAFNTISSGAETFSKLFDFIFEVAEKILITKETKEDEIIIKIDMEKFSAFMDDLKVLSAEKIVKKYIGENFLEDVLEFLDDSYERTVEATLNALSDNGIVVKDILTFISAIMGEEFEYDEMFTNEVLKENSYEFLCDFTGFDIPEFEDIESLVNEFKDLTLYEILKKLDVTDSETSDEFWDETMEGFDEFKESFKCELVANKFKQFERLELVEPSSLFSSYKYGGFGIGNGVSEFLHYDYSSERENFEGKITITSNFDFESVKTKAEEGKTKINAILDAFDFTKEASVINMLNAIYGVEFSFAEKDGQYSLYISEPTTKFNYLYTDYHNSEENEHGNKKAVDPLNIKGQLEIVIDNDVYQDAINNLNSRSDDGKIWGKRIDMSFCRGVIEFYEEKSNGNKNELDFLELNNPGGNFIFNENSQEFSYSLLTENDHFTIVKESNYTEFHNYYPYVTIDKEDINKLVFYKKTCKYCDDFNFYVFLKDYEYYLPRNGGVINSPYMDAEARKYRISLYQENYDGQERWNLNISSYISGMFHDNWNYANLKPVEQRENFVKYEFGNVTITIETTPDANCNLLKKETITIDIGGKEKIIKTNYIHDKSYLGDEEKVGCKEESRVDGCITYVDRTYYCKVCGGIISQETSRIENHMMKTTTIVEPTLTLPGIELQTCSICGEKRYNHLFAHEHYIEINYETGEYFCKNCEATFEYDAIVDYAVEKVEYDVYEEYWNEEPSEDYFFSVKNLISNYWHDYYDDVLTIAWVDPSDLNDDGSFKIDPEYALSQNLKLSNGYYVDIGNEEYHSKECINLYRFDKDEYDSMAAKAEAEGKTLAIYEVTIPEHVHTYSEDYCFNETAHWHYSTCIHNVISDFGKHTFDKNNVCTVCGYQNYIEEPSA